MFIDLTTFPSVVTNQSVKYISTTSKPHKYSENTMVESMLLGKIFYSKWNYAGYKSDSAPQIPGNYLLCLLSFQKNGCCS